MAGLELRSISCLSDGVKLLDSISFSLEAGEITALLGPSGSGKSLLLAAVSGRCPLPVTGRITFDGAALPADPSAVKLGVPFPLEQLRPKTTVLGAMQRAAAAYRGIETPYLKRLLQQLGLEKLADRPAASLCPGQQALLSVATAFAGNPRLIVMDEPFARLDPEAADALGGLMSDFASRKGAVVLFSTGQCCLAERLCGSALVLSDGRLMEKIDIASLTVSGKSQPFRYTFVTDKPYAAAAVLSELSLSPITDGDRVSAIFTRRQLYRVLSELIRSGVVLYNVISPTDSLRDRYVDALRFMGGFSL